MKPISCFVAMPFSKDFDVVYKKHIKPLIEEDFEDIECIRMDEQPKLGYILHNIQNEIDRCTFVIADISIENPNVFFEIGYAYGHNKIIIFIKHGDLDDIPVDINNLIVIGYDRDKGYDGLRTSLRRTIDANIRKTKQPQSVIIEEHDDICGYWVGAYQIKKQKYKVQLSIFKEKRGNSFVYNCECVVSIDNKYIIFQALKYNGILNQRSLSPEEWKNGKWIEFVGTSWTNLPKSALSNYLLNAYAINRNLKKNRLHVKIWDNVNHKKKDVFFKRVKAG